MLSERRLKFTADHAVGYPVEEVVLVERCVEPEIADVALRIQSPDQLTGFDTQSDRRVHGSRDSHEVGSADLGLVDNLDGEIQAFYSMAAQARSRRWRLDQVGDMLFRRGRRRLVVSRARLDASGARMSDTVRRRIRHESARLAELAAAMDALSPLSTLARGYAVPLDGEGRLLRGVRDFKPGRDFGLRVVDGHVPCAVTGPALDAPLPVTGSVASETGSIGHGS